MATAGRNRDKRPKRAKIHLMTRCGYFLLIGATVVGAPAAAQTLRLKPAIDARLRHETARQDELPHETSDAVTVRVRAGVTATTGPWAANVAAQGNLAIVRNYYDGLHGTQTRPLVADPQNVALFMATLRYQTRAVALTVGRQRIALDDERFVGAIPFRQNSQTFDAVRAELTPVKGVKADIGYVRAVRTLWGVEGNGARQQAVSGDTILANVGWVSPLGTLTGFAYLVDQDEAIVQGYRLSSQTYGMRLAGTRSFGKATLTYQASHARQSDYRRNPNDYAARYYLVDASLDLDGPRLGGGYEVLGAHRGVALTSFQTPLASNFKFNGWAERFTAKPADGLRDLYGHTGYGWKAIGPLTAVSVQATYHRFASDRLVRHYGNEIDLIASARVGRTTASIRFADYAADRFATDTRKLWLQLDWAI